MWIAFDGHDGSPDPRAIPVSRVTAIFILEGPDNSTLRLRVAHDPIVPTGSISTTVTGKADEIRDLYLSLLSLTARLDMSTAVIISRLDDASPWKCERLAAPPPPSRTPASVVNLQRSETVNHYGHKTPDDIAASVRRRTPSTACPIEQEPLLAPLVAAGWYPMRDLSGEPMGVLMSAEVGASVGGGLGEWFAQADVTVDDPAVTACEYGTGTTPREALFDLASKMAGHPSHTKKQEERVARAARLLPPANSATSNP